MSGHAFDELLERNATLRAENETLRTQLAELLPWARAGADGRTYFDFPWLYGTAAQAASLLTRIDDGKFGEVQ